MSASSPTYSDSSPYRLCRPINRFHRCLLYCPITTHCRLITGTSPLFPFFFYDRSMARTLFTLPSLDHCDPFTQAFSPRRRECRQLKPPQNPHGLLRLSWMAPTPWSRGVREDVSVSPVCQLSSSMCACMSAPVRQLSNSTFAVSLASFDLLEPSACSGIMIGTSNDAFDSTVRSLGCPLHSCSLPLE